MIPTYAPLSAWPGVRQTRPQAIRKEITETEKANGDLKKTLGRTDLKKLKEQRDALATQVRGGGGPRLRLRVRTRPCCSSPCMPRPGWLASTNGRHGGAPCTQVGA